MKSIPEDQGVETESLCRPNSPLSKTRMSLLVVKNMTKRFGGLVALEAVNLEVQALSIHSLIGPNGAGKTTLFNCLTGFYHPEEGEMYFDGRPLTGLLPDQIVRRGISRTYQNIRLFHHLTVLENVLVGFHIHLRAGFFGIVSGLPAVRKEEKLAEEEGHRLLELVRLGDKRKILAKNLPYGEQRRLEIARALATQPKLLLLDEPTAGMNPSETREMTEFICGLRDRLGLTVLLIEHRMRVVMGISERVTVLDYGKKIAEGTPAEIRENEQVIEAYLGRGRAGERPRPPKE
jgi:branched-chain amino acid transport system ATP-binding protein